MELWVKSSNVSQTFKQKVKVIQKIEKNSNNNNNKQIKTVKELPMIFYANHKSGIET